MDNSKKYQMPRKSNIRYELNKKDYKKRNKKNNEKIDILFFHFLDIIRHPLLNEFYNKHVEKNVKLEICQKFDHIKYKKKDAIEYSLSFLEFIDIPCLAYLAYCHNINMVFVSDNLFCHLNKSTNIKNKIVYVVKPSKTIHVYEYDNMLKLIENSYEIKDCNKVIHAISYYKVDELKSISNLLGVALCSRTTKKGYYNQIKEYIENAFDISEKLIKN